MKIKIVKLEAVRCGFRVGQTFEVRRAQAANHCRRAGYFVFVPSHSQTVEDYKFLAADEVEVA